MTVYRTHGHVDTIKMPTTRTRDGARSPSGGSSSYSYSSYSSSRSRSRSPAHRGSRHAPPRRDDGPRGVRHAALTPPPRRRKSPEPSCVLLVRNLTRNVTDAHLKEIFGTCGAVKTAEVAIDPTVGLSKGHARVELSTRALAVAAVEQFDGAQVDGMRMKVALSDAPPERAAAQPPPRNGVHWQGGGYHGGGGKGGGHHRHRHATRAIEITGAARQARRRRHRIATTVAAILRATITTGEDHRRRHRGTTAAGRRLHRRRIATIVGRRPHRRVCDRRHAIIQGTTIRIEGRRLRRATIVAGRRRR